MRQLIKISIILIFVCSLSAPAFCALKGGLEYQIPIDYSKLSTEELENKAGFYYGLALKTSNGKVNDDMTSALNLYTILSSKNPENTFYKIRLGHLYDIIGKDRYAKGYFFQAIGTDSSQPEPYFRLGEFYYRRELYKKALNMYKEAYKRGYSGNYDTLYKIGDIYEKFGDTEAALKYLKLAAQKSPNSELDNKIKRVENANAINKEYYSDTRIRLMER
ncbi:TPA: hypothetical protein CPT96_04365 [Candidatus Gastranaerophilales bacterium HUM_10]|nr:MAG TPA: hypothetical protein CPT96_04365 [Candidatus Gastranaerophilales bacterium HUM_10]